MFDLQIFAPKDYFKADPFVFVRVNVRSDCVVGFYEPKLLCKLCDREGHTQISCDYAASKVGPNMSYADSVFWQFVDPDDRPEGYDQARDGDYNDFR